MKVFHAQNHSENTICPRTSTRWWSERPEDRGEGTSPATFIIVMVDQDGERIPLTIADSDAEAGTLTLVVMAVGDIYEENDCPGKREIR